MGLDMYAYTVPLNAEADKDGSFGEVAYEIAYWRKFNALHGWMEDLWRSRGEDLDKSFNCIPVKLSLEDLDRLKDDLTNDRIEPRQGFFFGSQEIQGHHVADTLRFIDEAKEAITNGRDVYYDSWW